MEEKLISVVMSNYNTPLQYLREAIDSILNQTYSNFEFIIIDDASTDGSLEYMESIDDSRIIIIKNQQNMGLTRSLNLGFGVARGEFIARMDSDDISLPTRFERQIQFMERNPDIIVCGAWFEKFGVESQIRRPVINNFEEYRCQLLFSNTPTTLCHSTAMIRKKMLDDNGITYNEILLKAQDYGLWSVCSRYGRIAILEEVLLKYRTHPKQISTKSVDEQTKYADFTSQQQLSELGIHHCDEANRWRYATVYEVNDFFHYYKWLQDIKVANNEKKIYHQESLKEYIDIMLQRGVRSLKKKPQRLMLFFKGNWHIRRLMLKMQFSNRIHFF